MSKIEHDAHAARRHAAAATFERPSYRSSENSLRAMGFKGLSCLDLGSGHAEFSQVMRDRLQMDVTCGDYIPDHLDEANRNGFKTIHVDLEAAAAEVDSLAATYAGQFDLVVSLAAIEHVFDSDNMLRFAHTVLKPGGHFLINTPNIAFLGYRAYSALSGNRPYRDGHHVRFWNFQFLRINLFVNGFDIVHDGRDFNALPFELLRRTLGGREWLVRIVSRFFLPCFPLARVPGLRSLCSDELTVVARKVDATPIGFAPATVYPRLERLREDPAGLNQAIARVDEAHRRGWLREHPARHAAPPKSESPQIVGLVLVKNEDLHIEQVIRNVAEFCDEIIICDHRSNDETPAIIERLCEAFNHMTYHRITHPRESHEFVEPYAGGANWIFAVDGDELYDPVGLARFREALLGGEYDRWWMIFGNVLNCTELDSERARGYLSPPCRSMVKLYNFNAIEAWHGPCPERLHGGTIVFRKAYNAKLRCDIHKETPWKEADLRCLHLCFLRRSSTEPESKKPVIRENIADQNTRRPIARAAIRWRKFTRQPVDSTWKCERYMRGDIVEAQTATFFSFNTPADAPPSTS
ncbi:MAG: methyltransferase domain-containing protein [Gemmatimonadetes bacterium]|nr:methyltransferase domain-containing protein [Gemmatimonadota bacterium]